MKIIEALKEQKLIIQKINSNRENIQKYASGLNTEKLILGTEKDQKAELDSLLQSSEDLITRYIWLKTRVDYTNLKTIIELKGKSYSLAELLIMKRNTNDFRGNVLASFNVNAANMRKRQSTPAAGMPETVVVQFYDEKKIDQAKRDLMDFHGSIDGTLEVVNATSDLIEEIV